MYLALKIQKGTKYPVPVPTELMLCKGERTNKL